MSGGDGSDGGHRRRVIRLSWSYALSSVALVLLAVAVAGAAASRDWVFGLVVDAGLLICLCALGAVVVGVGEHRQAPTWVTWVACAHGWIALVLWTVPLVLLALLGVVHHLVGLAVSG